MAPRIVVLFAAIALSMALPAAGQAQALAVSVVVESEHASVTAGGVRAAMNECGVNALAIGDAPDEPVGSLAIVFRAPGQPVSFRFYPLQGDPVVERRAAPTTHAMEWVARRACRFVTQASTRAPRPPPARAANASGRSPSEVLNPWGDGALAATLTDPWRGGNRAAGTRSVGSVAGAAVAHFSEVLDPWSQTRTPGPAEVLDPWADEGAEGLARPRRRRQRR